MKKILICDGLHPDALEELNSISDFDVTLKTGMDEEELLKTIPVYNAAVVRSATTIRKRVIDAASDLEIIVRAGIGLDNIDVSDAEEAGIQVTDIQKVTGNGRFSFTFSVIDKYCHS